MAPAQVGLKGAGFFNAQNFTAKWPATPGFPLTPRRPRSDLAISQDGQMSKKRFCIMQEVRNRRKNGQPWCKLTKGLGAGRQWKLFQMILHEKNILSMQYLWVSDTSASHTRK